MDLSKVKISEVPILERFNSFNEINISCKNKNHLAYIVVGIIKGIYKELYNFDFTSRHYDKIKLQKETNSEGVRNVTVWNNDGLLGYFGVLESDISKNENIELIFIKNYNQ